MRPDLWEIGPLEGREVEIDAIVLVDEDGREEVIPIEGEGSKRVAALVSADASPAAAASPGASPAPPPGTSPP